MISSESGRPMVRGEKMVSFKSKARPFNTGSLSWSCSLEDPSDMKASLVDEDNLIPEMGSRAAEEMVNSEQFSPRNGFAV